MSNHDTAVTRLPSGKFEHKGCPIQFKHRAELRAHMSQFKDHSRHRRIAGVTVGTETSTATVPDIYQYVPIKQPMPAVRLHILCRLGWHKWGIIRESVQQECPPNDTNHLHSLPSELMHYRCKRSGCTASRGMA